MIKSCILFLLICLSCINTFAQSHYAFKHGDYLIMWTCGGMVALRHNTIYCITDTGFSSDTTHSHCYSPGDISELRHLQPLPKNRYDKAKKIPNSIPVELMMAPKYGCGRPMVDGITTYVVAAINGKKYQWSFGSITEDCTPDVRQFVGYLRSGF